MLFPPLLYPRLDEMSNQSWKKNMTVKKNISKYQPKEKGDKKT
jgi:hypothetical protein